MAILMVRLPGFIFPRKGKTMQLIEGKQDRPQKVLIYGVAGIGKSTFASKFPAPVFLDVEDRTAHLDIKRYQPKNYSEIKDCLLFLNSSKHNYKTVVLDTADWTEQIIERHVCDTKNKVSIEDFGYGKGYKLALSEFSHPEQEFFQGIIASVTASMGPVLKSWYSAFYNIGKDDTILINDITDILMDYSMEVFTRLRLIEIEVNKLNREAVVNDKSTIDESSYIMSKLILTIVEDINNLK
jgi:hypothetical protein